LKRRYINACNEYSGVFQWFGGEKLSELLMVEANILSLLPNSNFVLKKQNSKTF